MGTQKEINSGKGLSREEIRGLGRLGAAYNYHFLSIKTFRCARAAAMACNRARSIRHQPESCSRTRTLPLLFLLSPICSLQQLLSSFFTTALEQGCSHHHLRDSNNHICFFWRLVKPLAVAFPHFNTTF